MGGKTESTHSPPPFLVVMTLRGFGDRWNKTDKRNPHNGKTKQNKTKPKKQQERFSLCVCVCVCDFVWHQDIDVVLSCRWELGWVGDGGRDVLIEIRIPRCIWEVNFKTIDILGEFDLTSKTRVRSNKRGS